MNESSELLELKAKVGKFPNNKQALRFLFSNLMKKKSDPNSINTSDNILEALFIVRFLLFFQNKNSTKTFNAPLYSQIIDLYLLAGNHYDLQEYVKTILRKNIRISVQKLIKLSLSLLKVGKKELGITISDYLIEKCKNQKQILEDLFNLRVYLQNNDKSNNFQQKYNLSFTIESLQSKLGNKFLLQNDINEIMN